jgi:hypothetical protein
MAESPSPAEITRSTAATREANGAGGASVSSASTSGICSSSVGGRSSSCLSLRSAVSRLRRCRITSGLWLSRLTRARSTSNSGWVPASKPACTCFSVASACSKVPCAIATRRSLNATSKYAVATSSDSWPRVVVRARLAASRPASAIASWAPLRPPE